MKTNFSLIGISVLNEAQTIEAHHLRFGMFWSRNLVVVIDFQQPILLIQKSDNKIIFANNKMIDF